jgi:GH25 family lysozyme M1 (1,4-beta-N-acetylmuramidase)
VPRWIWPGAIACAVVTAATLAATPVLAREIGAATRTAATGPAAAAPAAAPAVAGTPGISVSAAHGTITWTSVYAAGIRFAYIKATEGTSTRDSGFNANYPNAYYAGIIRGAYHLAVPSASTGTVQADFLASNGGAWSADGKTLPAALDIEANTSSGGYCYGLSVSGMVGWITAFVNEYHARTGRWAVLHTTASFWRICTGSSTAFAAHSPLSVVHWDTTAGTLPAGWSVYTFWQPTDCQAVSGVTGCAEGSTINGAVDRLVALANNT